MKTAGKEVKGTKVLARSITKSTLRVIEVPHIINERSAKNGEPIIPKGFESLSCPFTGGYCKMLCIALLRDMPTKGEVSCAAIGAGLKLGKLKAK